MDDRAERFALLAPKKRELATNLVNEINAKHAEAVEAARAVEDATDRMHAAAKAVGMLVLEAQKVFTRAIFEDAILRFLNFPRPALRSYCIIATRKHQPADFKSKWRSLKSAAGAVELVPLDRGHGTQTLRAPSYFTTATKWIMNVVSGYRKEVSNQALPEWSESKLEQFAEEIRPIVEIYSQVHKQLAAIRRGQQ